MTGNIAVNQIKLPYKAAVIKCPLKFSTLKVDFPTLQIGERNTHLFVVKNYSPKTYICEFCLPHFELCGIKISPMVFKLSKGKSVELNLEYHSFMKKLGYSTLADLDIKLKHDASRNFQLKLESFKQEELKARQPPPQEEDPKKGQGKAGKDAVKDKPVPEKKKTKKELEEEEEKRKKEEEEQRRQQEEERKRRLEEEARFDMKGELSNLGGKVEEFEVEGFISQHYTWLVPCYFKPVDEPETARSTMFIELTSVTTSKILISDKAEINFGEVAVGFRRVEELLITNLGKTRADLRMDLLPLLGGFNVLNALKSIPPGKTRNIVLQFEPYNQQEFKRNDTRKLFNDQTTHEDYKQTLTIHSGQSSISVKLQGSSVKPEVTINPLDGLLNLGATLPNEKLEKAFEIKNVSNFSLEFNLKLLGSGIKRTDGQEAFLYIPSKGTLKAGENLQVKIIFNPDRVSEEYYNFVKIDVPNQKTERFLYLKGACFPRQAYVCQFKAFEMPQQEELQQKVEQPLDFIRQRDLSFIIGSDLKLVQVAFPKLSERVAKDSPLLEKRLVIGSCKLGDPKLEKAVNFELNLTVEIGYQERRELGLLHPREQQGQRRSWSHPDHQVQVQADRAGPLHRRNTGIQGDWPVG